MDGFMLMVVISLLYQYLPMTKDVDWCKLSASYAVMSSSGYGARALDSYTIVVEFSIECPTKYQCT